MNVERGLSHPALGSRFLHTGRWPTFSFSLLVLPRTEAAPPSAIFGRTCPEQRRRVATTGLDFLFTRLRRGLEPA
jgi:hypothetical protein